MAASAGAFDPGLRRWVQGLDKTRNLVRQELVVRQLMLHLRSASEGDPVSVLDIGCGQGTLAIRLAREGHHVVGVDPSEELLEIAAERASREPPPTRARLHFESGAIGSMPQGLGVPDVVCCHGVLMYLPTLQDALAQVVSTVQPGGIVSLLTRNRAGLAMRAAMNGDWQLALESFDARNYRNRLGIDNVRADEPEEIRLALAQAGAERIEWYGVRLFSDHFDDEVAGPDFAELLSVETEAGRRDPYRSLAALTHTIART